MIYSILIVMDYKHIIWDWNGTLLDDRAMCVKSINQILIDKGLPVITLEKYMRLFTFPVKAFYEKLGFDFTKNSFDDIGDGFIDFYNKNFKSLKLHKNTVTTLLHIKKMGKTQAVLSAAMEKMLKNWISDHDLRTFFTDIVGVDNQYAHGKIDIGKRYIEKLNINRKEILMIGDTPHDSEVAEAAGIDCILVEHGHVSKIRLKETGRKTFQNFLEVKKYL